MIKKNLTYGCNKGYAVLMHKVQQRAECQQLLLRLPLVIILKEQNAQYMWRW